jgi:hypothetical protein
VSQRHSEYFALRTVAVAAAFALTGCSLILGESFIMQPMHNPVTGKQALCVGHLGRGGPSGPELDTMNACIAWYEAQGYLKGLPSVDDASLPRVR